MEELQAGVPQCWRPGPDVKMVVCLSGIVGTSGSSRALAEPRIIYQLYLI